MFRWTAEQVYYLAGLGFFGDRHVELLDGILYEMTINPPHGVASGLVREFFQRHLAAGYCLRDQLPLDFGRRSLPEPDLAVVAGSQRDYVLAHPRTSPLIVEVSDSTLRKDRVIKGHIYAQAGMADYWIVNLVDRQLEIHRDPGPDPSRKGRSCYRDVTIAPAGDVASPLGFPQVVVPVADLLP